MAGKERYKDPATGQTSRETKSESDVEAAKVATTPFTAGGSDRPRREQFKRPDGTYDQEGFVKAVADWRKRTDAAAKSQSAPRSPSSK